MTFNEMFVLCGIREKKLKEKIEQFFFSPEKFLWNYEDIEEMLSSVQIKRINVLRNVTQKDVYDTLRDSQSIKRMSFVQDVVLEAVNQYPKVIYQNTEMLIFILVNVKNEIVKTFKIESSAHDRCFIDMPSISRKLILNDDVRGFFTIHNHPSGDCTPSSEDIETFKKFKNVGELLRVQNMDNIVIGQAKNTIVKIYSSHANQTVEVEL